MTEDSHFVIQAIMYLPVPGFEPTSSVFPDECVTRWATVADNLGWDQLQRIPESEVQGLLSILIAIKYMTPLKDIHTYCTNCSNSRDLLSNFKIFY